MQRFHVKRVHFRITCKFLWVFFVALKATAFLAPCRVGPVPTEASGGAVASAGQGQQIPLDAQLEGKDKRGLASFWLDSDLQHQARDVPRHHHLPHRAWLHG